MRRCTRNILIAAMTGATAGCALNLQQESQCQAWPTEEFFQEATAATVVACLDAGADPMAQYGRWGSTALHAAMRASTEPRVIEILLEAGVDANVPNDLDETPLKGAVASGHRGEPAVIEALLAAGADPNLRGSNDWTPLHSAAVEAEDARIVNALIAAGAELEARTGMTPHDAGGETPLHIAIRHGAMPAAIDALLAAGADVRARDKYGATPMHGLHSANETVAELLLNAGGNVDTRDGFGRTPLHSAAGAEPAVIRRLLEAGVGVEAQDEADATPLHHVAKASDLAAQVELLLVAGADPMARDRADATPLHYAAQGNGNPGLFRALVEAGADVDARDFTGQTPLHYAAENDENPAAFLALLAAGADVEARDHDGQTLLHAAAHGEIPTVVEALLAAGADVNARDARDRTPLHEAAMFSGWDFGGRPGLEYGGTGVVEALLAAGADVSARDSSWRTPLHMAAGLNQNPTIVELLLIAGADRNAQDDAGNTPLDLASRKPHEIGEVLRAHPLPDRRAGTDVEHVEIIKDCPICPDLSVLPAGRFRMGCVYESHACGSKSSLPAREVDVASFALSKFEVTRGQFAAFVAATGHDTSGGCEYEPGSWRVQSWQSDSHPVVCVNWNDAQAYVQWLREETGHGYRLPTEAEWEYAIRAGTKTRFHWGYRAPDRCTYENGGHCDNDWERTAPVGSFRSNGFGLHDMAGNVSEWVQDCWHENYDGAPLNGCAWISGGECGLRVVRGGSWRGASPRHYASGDRHEAQVGFRLYRLGFRVARNLKAP